MPIWAAVLLALGTAVFGGFAGVWWQSRKEDARRAEDRQNEERQRGVEAVSPVRKLFLDSSPDAFLMWVGNPGVEERFVGLCKRWGSLRVSLALFKDGHSSAEVRDLAEKVDICGAKMFNRIGIGMEEVQRHDPGNVVLQIRNSALAEQAAGVSMCDQLLRIVRGDPEDKRSLAEVLGPAPEEELELPASGE